MKFPNNYTSKFKENMDSLVRQLKDKKVEARLQSYFKSLCRKWTGSDVGYPILLEHLWKYPEPLGMRLARLVVKQKVFKAETDAYTRHKTKTIIKNKESGMFNEMYCKDDDFYELFEVSPICINEEEYDKFVQTCYDSEDDDICLFAHVTWAGLDLMTMAKSMPNPKKRIKELRARVELGKEKIQNLYFF